ncbi:uncharacterized protein [Rutidosis leptorrhynchoides]|uniref:uncharacterized protein n=1 Tax=Rutidosis leptorrhynchoides TaxID=125765 RepID=UPI003A993490
MRNGLIEIDISGKKFTRISDDGMKFSKLDRFLVDNSFLGLWDDLLVIALDRHLSNHCPLILRDKVIDYGPKPFKVFDEWFNYEEVDKVIMEAWKVPIRGSKKDRNFRDRLKNVKFALREWSTSKFGGLDREIDDLNKEVLEWELKAEANNITNSEREKWLDCRRRWGEKTKTKANMLKQKARLKWTLEGDENTKFFHAIIRRKNTKCNFRGLNINGAWIEDPTMPNGPLHSVSVTRPVGQSTASPINNSVQGSFKLSDSQAVDLEMQFSEEEIWEAVKGCANNKAPGPDGFNMRFFKKFWAIISADLIEAIRDFWRNGTISPGFNSSFITLIPKVANPVSLSEYRPISLIDSFYKIIAKLLSNRIKNFIPNLVGFEQSAFIKGRNIMDGVLIANESLEFLRSKHMKSMVFKVNFEKAFDSLNWEFLDEMMFLMGFDFKWRRWIASCLGSASISVLVNGSPTKEFNLGRGVRQGDPLSPFLFIIAAEGLNWMAKSAVAKGLFCGVEIGNDRIPLSHLQYADETIFFGKWSFENMENLMKLLKCFELNSGLKVNYNKSNLFGVGVDKDEVIEMTDVFGCKMGSFPMTYLGLPIGANMKKLSNWKPVFDKFGKRLSDWKARTISFGGRLTLVNAVLNSLPLYYFSLFRAPPSVLKKLECIRHNAGVEFTRSFEKKIGNGRNTRFWEDAWLLDKPLKEVFKRLVRLESNPHVLVANRIQSIDGSIVFSWNWSRIVTGRTKGEMDNLESLLSTFAMDPEKEDYFSWKLSNCGSFSTKKLTKHIMEKMYPSNNASVVSMKNTLVPKKVEVFIWRAKRVRLPVLSELDKRGIDLHSVLCPLCDKDVETVDHSILSCSHVWVIWERVREWWGFD